MSTSDFSPEFENILADCLDAVLSRQWTIAACLERYPDYAADLKPELEIAVLTSRLRAPRMSTASVDALEERLRMNISASAVSRRTGRPAQPFLRWAAGLAIALIIALGTGTGAVAASSTSLPGDPLYAVKRLWEGILIALAPFTGELDDLWLSIAETRLGELEALQLRGDLDADSLAELYVASANTLRYLEGADDQTRVRNFMTQAVFRMELLTLPPDSASLYEDVLQVLQPSLNTDGQLQAPPNSIAPSLLNAIGSEQDVTLSPQILVVTNTETSAPSSTPSGNTIASATASATPLPSVTPTPTSRIPATATRTIVPTVTSSATWTPSPTPTSTWTPLPLPVLPPQQGGPVAGETPLPLPQFQPTAQPDVPPLVVTERIRATQLSVFMTQTVEALTPSPTAGSSE